MGIGGETQASRGWTLLPCLMAAVLALVGCGTGAGPRAQQSDGAAEAVVADREQPIEAPVGQPGAPAKASVATGRDRARGARFSLRSRTLTVRLSPRSDARGLAGQQVLAACVAQARQGDGAKRRLRWPARTRALTVRFRTDAGQAPLFCSIDTASLSGRTYHLEAVLR